MEKEFGFTPSQIGSHKPQLHHHHSTRAYINQNTSTTTMDASPAPPTWRYILGFLLVGVAWGATTPFMRKAAVSQKPPPPRQFLDDQKVPWIKRKVLSTAYSILDLLKNPAYAIPLLLNVTGSVWFFLLIGEAGTNRYTKYSMGML